ncbi:MAG: type IV pilin N-terminal domain-containing protein, partial [Halobacteriales archaeon]|nr:type IV pilin N-terminal domain-containing protein [Halobacteriales archaeon]
MGDRILDRRVNRYSQGTDSRAASAVIGSLLLVAVVLVLAGTTLLLGQSIAPNPSETDRASFSFTYSPSGNQDTLTITHDGGDRLAGDRIAVVVTGASPPGVDGTYDWTGASLNGDGTVQSGDSVTLDSETIGDASRLDLDSASIRVKLQSPEGTRSCLRAPRARPDLERSGAGPTPRAQAVTEV